MTINTKLSKTFEFSSFEHREARSLRISLLLPYESSGIIEKLEQEEWSNSVST